MNLTYSTECSQRYWAQSIAVICTPFANDISSLILCSFSREASWGIVTGMAHDAVYFALGFVGANCLKASARFCTPAMRSTQGHALCFCLVGFHFPCVDVVLWESAVRQGLIVACRTGAALCEFQTCHWTRYLTATAARLLRLSSA